MLVGHGVARAARTFLLLADQPHRIVREIRGSDATLTLGSLAITDLSHPTFEHTDRIFTFWSWQAFRHGKNAKFIVQTREEMKCNRCHQSCNALGTELDKTRSVYVQSIVRSLSLLFTS